MSASSGMNSRRSYEPQLCLVYNILFKKLKTIIAFLNLIPCSLVEARRPEGKRPLGRPRRRWVDNIKMDLREIGWDGLD
jgi:hypothetical protein